jgi:membrane associated rhomboid family serine protease
VAVLASILSRYWGTENSLYIYLYISSHACDPSEGGTHVLVGAEGVFVAVISCYCYTFSLENNHILHGRGKDKGF